jgi:hypothetical protein
MQTQARWAVEGVVVMRVERQGQALMALTLWTTWARRSAMRVALVTWRRF